VTKGENTITTSEDCDKNPLDGFLDIGAFEMMKLLVPINFSLNIDIG
jgi:hypothetical protein